MSTAAVRGVVRHLGLDAPPTDAALLTRYARHRDNAAFAELLRRHGPVVLGVCRRTLSDPHAAEDAFQAVFLVLARKAGSVRPPGRVGGWLYGVAVRTAKKAKVAAARRWRREMGAAPVNQDSASPDPAVGAALERSELRAVIDDELARLPARLREPVVLCDLGGKSRSEAAAELGWPEGTVAARLAKARKVLADRLTRRGVALPAAGLACLASEVTPALARSTLAAADAFGLGLASSAVSPTAQVLAEGVLRAMTTGKMKLAAVLILAGGLLAGATSFWGPAASGGPQASPPVPVRPAANQPGGVNPAANAPTTLTDVSGPVVSVAFAPNGQTFAAGTADGKLTVYETATRRKVWVYGGSAAHPAAVAYSPDGKFLAVTYADGARLIDAATGKTVRVVEESGSKPTAVAFGAPKAIADRLMNRLAFTDGQALHAKTWIDGAAVGGAQFGPLARSSAGPAGVAYSPDGEELVFIPNAKIDPEWIRTTKSGDMDPKKATTYFAQIWGGGSGKPMRFLPHGLAPLTAVAWSADGKRIATGAADGSVILWDAATGKQLSRHSQAKNAVHALAFSPDGKILAAATDFAGGGSVGQVVLIAPDRNVLIRPGSQDFRTAPPVALAFSPDGKTLLAGCGSRDPDGRNKVGELRLFAVAVVEPQPAPKPEPRPEPAAAADGWKEAAVLTHHAGPVDSVAFAPNGQWFVTGGADGRVYKWEAATLRPSELGAVIPAGAFTSVAVSPDGTLVAATRDKVTGFFDPLKQQTVLMKTTFPGGRAVAFSPDGKWLGFSNGDSSGFRAVATVGPAAAVPPGPGKGQASVAWSPDSRCMIYAGGPGVIGLVGPPEARLEHSGITAYEGRVAVVAWSADGKRIAAAGEAGWVGLWDAKTFAPVRRVELPDGRGGKGTTHALAFSPDGGTLAAAVEFRGPNGRTCVQILDAATGRVVEEHRSPGAAVRSLAFSPDGKLLVAACGIDHAAVKPLMTPDEMKAAGAVVVWARGDR
jgi:RNA polymerase sigma factor (sigma-70 family)